MKVSELIEMLDGYGGNVPVVISDGNTHYDIEVIDASPRGVVTVVLGLADLPDEDEDDES